MQERLDDIRRILGLLDLTSLNEHDAAEDIEALCRRSVTAHGRVAAVCICPAFVTVARQTLEKIAGGERVAVATVANFPAGDSTAETVAADVGRAVVSGAHEVDVVFPWRAFLEGEERAAAEVLRASREACGERALKVILETGRLRESGSIRRAGEIAIESGADFLKTSTGKVPVNATPEAARILIETIRDSGRDVGCKVSGGIRDTGQALEYFDLAAALMGEEWLTARHFRFGASGLLDRLLMALKTDRGGVPGAAESG